MSSGMWTGQGNLLDKCVCLCSDRTDQGEGPHAGQQSTPHTHVLVCICSNVRKLSQLLICYSLLQYAHCSSLSVFCWPKTAGLHSTTSPSSLPLDPCTGLALDRPGLTGFTLRRGFPIKKIFQQNFSPIKHFFLKHAVHRIFYHFGWSQYQKNSVSEISIFELPRVENCTFCPGHLGSP